MKDAYLGIVTWRDPCFHLGKDRLAFEGKSSRLLARQQNIGYITEDGDNIVVINAITNSEDYDLTVIPKSLVSKIEKLVVKK